MKAYRVKNWDQHFENNRSKTVVKLAWVPIPNSHDSEGFAMVMAHRDGAEIFAAWILILQVASRCQSRGSLVRENGRPYDAASLALRTRGNAKWFEKAIPVLLEVGWIEEIASDCQAGDTPLPPACQSGDQEGKKEKKGTERNGIERNGSEPNGSEPNGTSADARAVEAEAFAKFWRAYPRKEAKGKAEEVWKKQGCTPIAGKIIAAVERYRLTGQWRRDGGQFIPHPTTFLSQKRWEDEPKPTGGHDEKTFRLTTGGPKGWNPLTDAIE
ncbi:hypothetical protein CfE428DRAFT_6426 [Chthoniobacter flavus Ellin428]|uniref:Uncharacterized protein n=1 Tax=Chthoniobacter flavus Ellin428 TaxID=497964 RepID=B4DBY5_9BACT|nr:hypothetical protein CfE428DRAFT_6426 [Chthoniobacter flavus Ellin428]TCO87748.1 hypothetical protein EV701_12047 [Chthoniobacter flavus]